MKAEQFPSHGRTSWQRGMSIVEVMISLAIGAVLVAGMSQVFLGVRTSYQLQDSLSRLQENARFADYLLGRELRQAGALGCLGEAEPVVHLDAESDDLLYGNFGRKGLRGFASHNDSALSDIALTGAGSQAPLDDSEVLLVRGEWGPGQVTTSDDEEKQSADSSANVFVDASELARSRISEGDVIAISDCENAVIAQVTDEPQTSVGRLNFNRGRGRVSPGNASQGFPNGMRPNADVVTVSTRIYYVAPNPEGEPALYRLINDGNPEELVAGVERMGFKFLENGLYRAVDEVNDWQAVEAVRAEILLRDRRQGLRDEDQQIWFMDEPENFDDRRMRLLVHATVALRN